MAHLVVYVQRTPHGIHPASALALCWARDIASERGATVTAVCLGDAGALDRGVALAAGRFGADVMLFGGPRALENLQERLRPVHVLTPWTQEGRKAVQVLSTGPAVPRWLHSRNPSWGGADAITGIVAGTLPWHDLDQALDAEYEGDVDEVPLPAWVEAWNEAEPRVLPQFRISGGEPRTFVPPPDGLDRRVEDTLRSMGFVQGSLADACVAATGTVLWLAPGAGRVPSDAVTRGPGTRLLLLPGSDGHLDEAWSSVDWVLPGPWPDVLDALSSGGWQAMD